MRRDIRNRNRRDDLLYRDNFQIWASIAFRFNQRVSFTYNQKVSFKLVATELLWFIKGDTTFNTYLNIITIYMNEWAFENYVQSDDYHGPDMTDFWTSFPTRP